MKNGRQEKILELISKYEIETQDEMISRLRADGYNVTQATISRDMRELKLAKVLTQRGTYKYTAHQPRHATEHSKLNHVVVDSIVSVDYAGNNVVLKTYPGFAQTVASGVDALNIDKILGCVGGDDTIIIVTRDEQSSAEISEKIREIMKGK